MLLMAAYSNVSLTYVPGVNGSKISEKAKPYKSNVTPTELGAWRAHANVWRKILDGPYETALVLEDDIDWDIKINPIMSLMTKHIPGVTPAAPWGHSSWDLLWLGACLHDPNPQRAGEDVRYDDPWGPTRDQLSDYDRKYFDKSVAGGPYKDSGERVIQRAHKPVCTMGYAVTKHAARKLLYNVGYRGLDGPVDLAMFSLHEKGILKGWVTWPALFNPWRVGGYHDSDIQSHPNGADKGNEGGASKKIKDSVRKAITKEYMAPAVY